MTPAEKKALLFLAAVLVLGGATKLVRVTAGAAHVSAADSVALAAQIGAVDSAREWKRQGKGKGMGKGKRPSRAGSGARDRPRTKSVKVTRDTDSAALPEPLDVDRASESEIEALPGVGPVLARRIIADREEHGAFGSMDAMATVRGVGPALRRRLEPLVTFSAPPRPPSATPNGASPRATAGRARAASRSNPTSRESGPEPPPVRIRGLGTPRPP